MSCGGCVSVGNYVPFDRLINPKEKYFLLARCCKQEHILRHSSLRK